MKLARFSLLFFIYSCQVFLGTPPVLLALQLLAMAIAIAAVVIVAVRQRNIVFPPVFLFFFLLFFAYLSFSAILAIELAQTPLPVMQRFFQVFLTTLAAPLLAYSFWRLGMMANERILKHILLATLSYTVFKLMIVACFLLYGGSVLMRGGFPGAVHFLLCGGLYARLAQGCYCHDNGHGHLCDHLPLYMD